jgi:hypothetical protein
MHPRENRVLKRRTLIPGVSLSLSMILSALFPAGALLAAPKKPPPARFLGTVSRYPAGQPVSPGFLFAQTAYLEVYNTPVRFRILDVERFCDGLEPREAGGGQQTRNLKIKGENGLWFKFRLIEKKESLLLEEHDLPFIRKALSDLKTIFLPYGAGMAAPLADALGVFHNHPILCVLPDSPMLGEFRGEFALRPGYLEIHPKGKKVDPGASRFLGAVQILKTTDLLERLDEHPGERVDAERFLTARLLDAFINDYDRHGRQYRWARFPDAIVWKPIAIDRDAAFVDIRGASVVETLIALHRRFNPKHPLEMREIFNCLTPFDENIANPVSLMTKGMKMDRRFLKGLDRKDWDRAVSHFREKITDPVIRRSIETLPPEIRKLIGDYMERVMKARRKALPAFADLYYRYLERNLFPTPLPNGPQDAQ